MDEMKLKLSTKFMRSIISKLIMKAVYNKFGVKADFNINELAVELSNGKLNFSEMKKQKYNLNDLLLQLRDKGIRTIEEVDYAILETNGKLSVFQKQDDNNNVFPLPLVLDGVIEENNLKFINKTRKWLNNELCKKKINLDNIFYAFYKDDEIYVIENEN